MSKYQAINFCSDSNLKVPPGISSMVYESLFYVDLVGPISIVLLTTLFINFCVTYAGFLKAKDREVFEDDVYVLS